MYNDARFTQRIRQLAAAETDIRPEAICVNCSHTHNAPTAGFIRGGGERAESYLEFAAKEAATAIIEAWRKREPGQLSVGHGELAGMTFNRARDNGPTDTRVSVLRADTAAGQPLAVAVNFHSHCTAHMEADLRAVGRDWPGEVVDQIEAVLPGATALYLQGTCGDVNFRREFNGTERRFEPAWAISRLALEVWGKARPIEQAGVGSVIGTARLPARRWTREEVMRDREEGLYRMRSGDTNGWLDGLGRSCVNLPERLPLRYEGSLERTVVALARFAVEWTDEILPVLETRSESVEVEVQALRVGDVWFAAHPAELFASLGLELRRAWPHKDLFMLGYANGSIGYLPDAPEIARGGYPALQSPKFTGQFPFTPDSGPALVEGLLSALERTAAHSFLSGPKRGGMGRTPNASRI